MARETEVKSIPLIAGLRLNAPNLTLPGGGLVTKIKFPATNLHLVLSMVS